MTNANCGLLGYRWLRADRCPAWFGLLEYLYGSALIYGRNPKRKRPQPQRATASLIVLRFTLVRLGTDIMVTINTDASVNQRETS